MNVLASMPASGIIVIAAIAILFVLAVLLLFYTWGRYKGLAGMVKGGLDRDNGFLRFTVNDFADAYKKYGQDVNTPAIISNAVSTKLSGLLLCERFLANAVSLFVTLGLFGTFLGLSHSVSSLTELISYSNTSEWLSVLDSVGGGLMSALSGMGVAFYTSLVGVACSIVLTLLRSIFSPQAERETLEARLELWLDHTVAPTLPTERAKDESEMVQQMVHAMDSASKTMERALQNATGDLKTAIDSSRAPITAFNKTVDSFNGGVRDFSEFNYNLRGTVERLDVTVRDLVSGLREVSRILEKGGKQ
ncbi:MAG: MotA/TolQ/ExbB proton channel family protein [Candidatus Limivicinus sp.]|nr:MotA/TolQ/ExbB proton channel family protein [Clostridiales bacterium]MDY4224369.1 MotA/TolQ/ExbB proton channel family protein [Candidatus Limivicinus sp.]MDY5082144.1 MotA/TolQ/ExbB proton channel family protein [Candidatus Limivicinus sp.]